MEVDSDFKSEFYNLEGITLEERKRNFQKLINSTSSDISEEEIDISPRNYQEKVFYVDVLLHFKRIDKLIDILKEGNGALTSRIFKHSWFFKHVFKDMKNEDIINKFLPEFYYSLRLKILKKASEIFNEERMDDLFDYISERYGLFIAQQFLCSCSSEKIIHIMKNYQINLHPGLLKRILQKNSNLIKVYFEEHQKNTGFPYSDSGFLKYAIWKEPNLFYELGEKYIERIKVGRCTTKRIIQLDKGSVIKNFDVFKDKIKVREVVKKVPDFGKRLLPQYFPPEMDSLTSYYIRGDLIRVLKSLPKKVRWAALSSTFKQMYNADILDHLKHFDDSYIQFFPTNIKNKWAEEKYSDDNLYYLKYFEPKTGVQLIKDKINFTSDINQRRQLLGELINLCCEGKDLSSFKDVLKYICQRHRNDDESVRSNIIGRISRVLDTKLALDDTHWNYINELVDVGRVKGLSLPFGVITQYIFYLFNKKCSLEETVLQYAKDCFKANKSFRLDETTSLECEGLVLKSIGKILPDIKMKLNKNILNQLFHDISTFNQTAKEYKIDINEIPVLVKHVEALCQKNDMFDKEDYFAIKTLLVYNMYQPEKQLKVCTDTTLMNIIKIANKNENTIIQFNSIKDILLRKRKRTPFEEQLLRHYFTECFDILRNYEKIELTEYFIRNEPSIIEQYYDTLLNFDSKKSFLQYDEIKKLGHLGLDKKLIEYFKPLAAVENQLQNKQDILRALSHIMTTEEFLDLVKGYVPTSRKLDLQNNEQREIYQVQCEVAKSFVNLSDYVKLTTVLIQFCQGDYLKSSLPALYKTMYHLDEARVKHYLDILSKRAVSTRKHAVMFCFQLLPVETAKDVYTSMSTSEKNASARKAYTTSILKYFLRNSLESLLDVVLANIDSIDKNDTELIDHFIEAVPKLPNKFKAVFIQKLWKFTDGLQDKTYEGKLLRFIQNIYNDVFSTLDVEFCQGVIATHFLQETDFEKRNTLVHFVIKYLEVHPEEAHFVFVFDIVEKYKAKYWGVKNKEKLSKIFNFFDVSLNTLSDKTVNFINLFKAHWERLFSPVETFSQCVLLKLCTIYQEKHDLHHFTTNVNKTCQELILAYGPLILEFLVDSIKRFFGFSNFLHDKEFNLAQFTLHLLQCDSSEYNCFIAVNLLKHFQSPRDVTLQISNILEKSNFISIKICFNSILAEY